MLHMDFCVQEKVISEDLEKNAKRINVLHEENTEMKTKLSDLEEENRTLEEALRDMQKQSRTNSCGFTLCFKHQNIDVKL